jgi:hypothetical protein
VVHLDLQISPQTFEKIRNGPNGILWGWGKLIHEKNQKQKSRDTIPLRGREKNRNSVGKGRGTLTIALKSTHIPPPFCWHR